MLLRYILFHHQTTTAVSVYALFFRCVISSFITKPQQPRYTGHKVMCCVISSFITKPQPTSRVRCFGLVALYPLSSPNHNVVIRMLPLVLLRYILFHHQTTTEFIPMRHNPSLRYILFHHQTTTVTLLVLVSERLRYILFHHQTTTPPASWFVSEGCVISSFITKPQPTLRP